MADTPAQQPGNNNPNQTPPAPNTGAPGDPNKSPTQQANSGGPQNNANPAPPNPNTGSATNNVPTVAEPNKTDKPETAPQNPVSTQPSQTLNPELPKASGNIAVRVKAGKHKYIDPDTGKPAVANIGDEVKGGVSQRQFDVFGDKFERI